MRVSRDDASRQLRHQALHGIDVKICDDFLDRMLRPGRFFWSSAEGASADLRPHGDARYLRACGAFRRRSAVNEAALSARSSRHLSAEDEAASCIRRAFFTMPLGTGQRMTRACIYGFFPLSPSLGICAHYCLASRDVIVTPPGFSASAR